MVILLLLLKKKILDLISQIGLNSICKILSLKQISNLISFFQSSSNEIGKVIYERVQNFLNNIINIDSCQYKALLSYYDTDDIDIKTILTANLPEKLEYLINVFSVSKLYFKNNFL